MAHQKEYALLCEFVTQSTNGMYSYMHVFDRTVAKPGSPIMLNGFLAVKFRGIGEKANMEMYMTDASNTLVEKGSIFKQEVKGDNIHVVARLRGLTVPQAGEYRFWARVDGAEPVYLCSWFTQVAEAKA